MRTGMSRLAWVGLTALAVWLVMADPNAARS